MFSPNYLYRSYAQINFMPESKFELECKINKDGSFDCHKKDSKDVFHFSTKDVEAIKHHSGKLSIEINRIIFAVMLASIATAFSFAFGLTIVTIVEKTLGINGTPISIIDFIPLGIYTIFIILIIYVMIKYKPIRAYASNLLGVYYYTAITADDKDINRMN